MALDKVILNHIDEMNEIEEKLINEIDFLFKNIDIELIIESPEKGIESFINRVKTIIIDNHFDKSAMNGLKFAEAIKKDGMVEVQKTKDADINKKQVNKKLKK